MLEISAPSNKRPGRLIEYRCFRFIYESDIEDNPEQVIDDDFGESEEEDGEID